MAIIKENAPLKSKSGGGYHFEHKVGAYFLSYLLANKNFDESIGEITRIDFQMRGDGFQIDDLCITFNFQGQNRRLFLSVKSSSQFTKNGAPKDFVEAVWIDFTGFSESLKFDKNKDMLGLACAPFGHENETDLYELLKLASSQDSKDLNTRLPTHKNTSDRVRTFFSSFKCPKEIAEKFSITDNDIGELLKCIKVYTFDFDYDPSEKKNIGISNCQSILSSGSQVEAEKLWVDLIEFAQDRDETNGYVDLKVLLKKFSRRYKLKNFPIYEQDLEKLDIISKNFVDAIPDKIGGKLSLSRDKQIKKILSTSQTVNLILGISGSGKSVVAKRIAEQIRIDRKLIWFDAGWFNDQSISQLENDWRLSHSISELFTSISDSECWVIIDGLDRIVTENGFHQLFQIINSCTINDESTPWKIIFTSQTEEWNNRILFQFLKHENNPTNWNITDIELFDDDEIKQIIKDFPSLRDIFKHPHLKSLLLRPKIIDLLATYGTPDASKWVGESDLINWFWLNEVINQKNGMAKSSFLQNIAERQAEKWQSSVPISEISPSDLVLYDDLKKTGLCTSNQNRIQFSHDLYGDWSRQQCLISHISDVSIYLKSRYDSPLWHRGIRLFGLYLLEQYQDPAEFLKVFFSIQKDKKEFTTIHDLLLESIIFAVNPLPILEKLWPEFKKDNGILLKRFLKRFLIIASIPNRQILVIGKIYGLSENEAALIDRIPVYQYWIPILQFIIHHKEELGDLAPEIIADIAKSWLNHTPVNSIHRREIANLTLTIAEKIKNNNSRWHYDDKELGKKAYSAAIAAINEDPERVAKLLISLSGKGEIDPSEEIPDTSIPPDYIVKLLPPWPDGPYKHVDELFQKMCIQENELTPVIVKNPNLATEILFSLIIEEPRSVNPNYDDDYREREFGLVDFHGIIPALPRSGPFFVFLQMHPSEGIDLITRIVNFATERYLERKVKLQKTYPDSGTDCFSNFDPVNSVEILLSGSPKILKGDHEVYYWYRDSGVTCCPRIISSMLMALEKFLYEKIDEKESIDTYIQTIYEKTSSVAMLGVLTSVGKYKLSLFEGPLLNLFSVSEIYQWDLIFNERSLSGIQLPILDDDSKKQLSKWHPMPHRKIPFYDLAITLFLNNSNMRSEFDCYREKWENHLATMDPDSQDYLFLYRLIQQCKLENYTIKEVNGEEGWLFNEPEELQRLLQKGENEYIKSQEGVQYLNFLIYCSNALKKGELFDQARLEEIWTYIQKLSLSTTPNSDPSRPFRDEDVIAGGIAVFFVLGKSWLDKNPVKKQWCIDQVFKFVSNPPPPCQFDSSRNINDMGWDSFCAWAAPHIWTDDLKSTKNREIVLSLAISRHYKTIEILFNSSFKIRAGIRDEFYQLVHLTVVNSFSRTFCQFCVRDPGIQKTHKDFVYWINQQFQNFIDGKLSSEIPDLLQVIEKIGKFIPPKQFGGRKWNAPGFQNRLILQSSFQWLSSLNQALDESERECWINLVKNINAYEIYSINDTARPKNDTHLPDDFDRWYFLVAATFITEMTDPQLSREIWQPFLDLETTRNYWTKDFLSFWFIRMYDCLKNPESFLREWQKMIGYALTAPLWNYPLSKNHSLEERWCQLIGIERELPNQWSLEMRQIVTTMESFYEKWAVHNLSRFHCLESFTHFLTMPASSDIRVPALKWLEQYGNSLQSGEFWKGSKQNKKLAELLNLCWENNRQLLVSDVDIFNTFKRLLKGLTDHQVPLAMELTEKIRTIL
ncbi:MAG: ATP-binding protein [Methanoregula sp.]